MPKTCLFRHRVAVHRGDEIVQYAGAALAAHLLDTGLARILGSRKNTISAIQLTGAADGGVAKRLRVNELGLRPGSFGVRVEALANGLACYSHRYPWDELITSTTTAPSKAAAGI